MSDDLKEYRFTGNIELSGVSFYIKAASLEEAKARATKGDWDDDDSKGAAWVNWEIDPHTGKENR